MKEKTKLKAKLKEDKRIKKKKLSRLAQQNEKANTYTTLKTIFSWQYIIKKYQALMKTQKNRGKKPLFDKSQYQNIFYLMRYSAERA